MNCEHCDQWLQEVLDGAEPDTPLVEHLVACPVCRDLYESALALRKGIADMPRPEPTAGLTDRVVTSVLFDRKQRQRQRQTWSRVAGLAASMLVALFVSEYRSQPASKTEKTVPTPPEVSVSLRKTVLDAGSAVVERARRQVGETIDSTLRLVQPLDSEPTPEPLVGPLQEASQGVTASLEPMTGSARRAFALLVRDLSPGGPRN